MRVCLTLRSQDQRKIVLPIDYNYLVQASIYNSISKSLAKFLHDKGFTFNDRKFKLFTFSRLLGTYSLDKNCRKFIFENDVKLLITSPIQKFIRDLANIIIKKGFIVLGESKLKVVEMNFLAQPPLDGEAKIRTLSPITVYSTLLTQNGRKKTYYYSPYEKEFSQLIDSNAKKKYLLLKGRTLKSTLSIEPIKVREVVVMYKGTVIKGWIGTFILKGPKSLIKVVYEAGLGSKNSQGFGMFEVI